MVKSFSGIRSALLIALWPCFSVFAADLHVSGKNELTENPFVAYGVNPKTQAVTGYLTALRTSPGRTDECKFVFSGTSRTSNLFHIRYLSDLDGNETGGMPIPAAVDRVGSDLFFRIKKNKLVGDCEWILPFIGEPRVKEDSDEVAISFGDVFPGNWIGVFTISSKRAAFHKSANESSIHGAYLIQGDLIYVYEEQPGWYYAKYSRGKRETVGWIKKSDTVQISNP